MTTSLPFDVNNVTLALETLYNQQSLPSNPQLQQLSKQHFPNGIPDADKYLTKYQSADPAKVVIPIATAILSSHLPPTQQSPDDKYKNPIVFFASSSLRKAVGDVHLIRSIIRECKQQNAGKNSGGYLADLRDLLLRCLGPSAGSSPEEGYRAVETQLVLTLAQIAIKMSWTTVVTDLISFVQAGQIAPLSCVNFLGVLNECVQSQIDVTLNNPNCTDEDYSMTVENFARTVLDSSTNSAIQMISAVFSAFLQVYDQAKQNDDKVKKYVSHEERSDEERRREAMIFVASLLIASLVTCSSSLVALLLICCSAFYYRSFHIVNSLQRQQVQDLRSVQQLDPGLEQIQ